MRAMVAMFDGAPVDAADDVVHPEYLDHQGLDGERPMRGVDGFVRVVGVARAASPGLRVVVLDLIAGPDRVAARIGWSSDRGDRERIDIVRVAPDGRAIEHWGAVG